MIPLISLGALSFVPFGFAARKTGARRFAIAAAIYLVGAIVGVVVVAIADRGNGHHALQAVGGAIFVVLALAGCIHTLMIRDEYARQLEIAARGRGPGSDSLRQR